MANGPLETFSLAYCRQCVPRCAVGAGKAANGSFSVASHELIPTVVHTDIKTIRVTDIFLDPGETPAQQLTRMDALYSGRYV